MILSATAETQHSQINQSTIFFFFKAQNKHLISKARKSPLFCRQAAGQMLNAQQWCLSVPTPLLPPPLVAWNWPWWEYLHLGNWQTSQIRIYNFPECLFYNIDLHILFIFLVPIKQSILFFFFAITEADRRSSDMTPISAHLIYCGQQLLLSSLLKVLIIYN